MYTLHNFDRQSFLRNYWQKSPVVLKQLLPDFDDPIDEHELAGLAMEEDIDARIVRRSGDQWHVAHGPFEDFSAQCVDQWSLLVQGVDNLVPAARALLDAFTFLPVWRREDVMVSFAVPGAGVGPHLDQYDVFIVQGKGQRHWQVGGRGDYQEQTPHPALRQVSGFEPVIDVVLSSGDVLYIPPGCPHAGQAITDSMSFSVGCRAPSQADLFSALADHLIDQCSTPRFADPNMPVRTFAGDLLSSEVDDLRQLMRARIDDPSFSQWLASHLSQPHREFAPSAHTSAEEVGQWLDQKITFWPTLNPRFIRIDAAPEEHNLWVNGMGFYCPEDAMALVESFLSAPHWQANSSLNTNNRLFFVQFLTKLINAGFWDPEL
ncbi:cupin domain-containing protein [Aestuariibacter halophilus]|uniref:Cupin domain-containing protein n=1 Tax=Fluctibacter halophilus TaxID=226011 RepID=A0ABS8G471_9ALTE|nr:cupin domain-containing protein [Aestuariibacter halophilus]MCC2615328.1 cupin domain-containing protein [Aestuariibacter halophilus]